jgi:hypothetical protein
MSYQGTAVSGELFYSTGDENLHDYSPLIGDVTGLVGATLVEGIAGFTLPTGAPVIDQIIKFNGSEWAYTPDATGTGTQIHSLLSPTHGDTVAQAVTRGDIIFGNSTPAWDALSLGTAEFVLYSDGTDVLYTRLGQNTPFENGSITLPSVTFTGDTSIGLYLPSAGTVAIAASGTALLTADGNVDTLTLNAGIVNKTTVAAGNTTLTAADSIVMVTAAAAVITMPASPTEGQTYIIKDRDGLSTGASKIIIEGNGNNIDSNSFIRLNNTYSSATLVYSGTEWNLV